MRLLKADNSPLLVRWFVKQHICPRCATEWMDEWSSACNDRCPVCDLESSPVSSVDVSRPLIEKDYSGAARRIAAFSHLSEFEVNSLPVVTDEQARDYAEARLEGQ
jgi:hypothetical protein